MIVQNQIGGGGPKIPAGTWVIVKGYVSSNSVSENFVVPIKGKYRITVVGKGGLGGSSSSQMGPYSGNGGGSGGWARSILDFESGESIPVTCNTSVSSFGSYLSATCGGDGSENVAQRGGEPGTATGGNDVVKNGKSGGAGKYASSSSNGAVGGNGAAVLNPGDSIFLSSAYGMGGKGGNVSDSWSNSAGFSAISSNSIFLAFGAGGGGGGIMGQTEYHRGGEGIDGAVIIELLLKGVNDA